MALEHGSGRRPSAVKEGGTATTGVHPPSITLPRGGGAIRGIGEKFAANPVTGTGSMSVPIATSPGRSGFGPQLSLSYDSGAGNGILGFGWSLAVPSITRKTDKGLPGYRDCDESDVFILSGAEDLVPVLARKDDDTWERLGPAHRTINGVTYDVERYRPRVEGLFGRIERWTNVETREIHWRSISRDNITTLYGKDNNSRIFDPAEPDLAHPKRIFSWLISESFDDKGNAIRYRYKEENGQGVELGSAHEQNRTNTTRSANRYLKRILYGNKTPRQPREDLSQHPEDDWLFEVVFDYGEHYREDAEGQLIQVWLDEGEREWAVRQDPFSSYRAGFEVRTYRLCSRVLMFHHFPGELDTPDYLVRATHFQYSQSPIASFIQEVTQSGYVLQNGKYLKKSLPPLEFEYSQASIQTEVHEVDETSLENLPSGLDGAHFQWVDLDGEGLSGILTEQGDAWFYKRNISSLPIAGPDEKPAVAARFAPAQRVASTPSSANLSGGHQQLMDLAGDGHLDLVELSGPAPGFYERTQDDGWDSFTPFSSLPNLAWNDPNLKFVDLTGDGHADILITEDQAFLWHPSLAEEGFGPGEKVNLSLDEEQGPRLVFADGTQSIYLSDISGDGLTDLVRIRNGEVCYWPNLGYGRFGAKVTTDSSPSFDLPGQFDQRRIRLADIDGSGTTDILYLAADGVNIYRNQAGNSWSKPEQLRSFPAIDNLSAVMALDLLGTGTACLVWSSPLPGEAGRSMRYIDLMGQKPHLLTKIVNNLGSETRLHYAPSTRFYLADKAAAAPWITRLPFPVHVVELVETFDWISGNYFVTRYSYHHGYYDGVEREFRGFGRVEQWDTEEFAVLTPGEEYPAPTNLDAASHVPPVVTRTWFHTGAYLDNGRISRHFEHEYYRESDLSEQVAGLTEEQARTMLLDDTVLPDKVLLPDDSLIPLTFTPDEMREACRALKGSILRQEIFARDGTDEEDRPYSVSERNYTLYALQPQRLDRHAVFFSHARETMDFHYERRLYDVILPDGKTARLADPRVSHNIVLAVDHTGNVLQSLAIGYGRRHEDAATWLTDDDRERQRQHLLTYTENAYTEVIDDSFDDPVEHDDAYRTPLPSEARTYELRNFTPQRNEPLVTNPFGFDEIQIPELAILYEDWNAPATKTKGQCCRLIEDVRTVYRSNGLTHLLAVGEIESMALPGETYKLAFTPGLLAKVFQRKRPDGSLENLLPLPDSFLLSKEADGGGYVDLGGDGKRWIPSGLVFYSPNAEDDATAESKFATDHFYLPHRFQDPFGNSVTVAYDNDPDDLEKNYGLLPIETRDPLKNTVRALHNYRTLQPCRITDPNGNQSLAKFDALGMVVATAVCGKEGQDLGDSLDDFTDADANPTIGELQGFAADPRGRASELLKSATTRVVYDLDRYKRCYEPPFAAALARETHVNPAATQPTNIQVSFVYSDGFGREVQTKIQSEPCDAPLRDPETISTESGDIKPGPLVVANGKPTQNRTDHRWVGKGRTVYSNKGKPVRQYEPFFSSTHLYETEPELVMTGVTPILFYDPAERVVATLHPNHTYEKVVFDPWRQTTWDVNDTLYLKGRFDPRTPDVLPDHAVSPVDDSDVGAFFQRLPPVEYLPTWLNERMDPGKALKKWPDTGADGKPLPGNASIRSAERDAAEKAARHAATPTTAHLDTLGRTFLTVADNGLDEDGKPQLYGTRLELDIEGNERCVTDALGRVVMLYDYDMLSHRIHQASMEAGERWMLNDVLGKPIRAWDSRGFLRTMTHDERRRPKGLYVTENGVKRLTEETIYGEGVGDAGNHRTRVYQVRDGAGIVTSMAYDFKGNLLESRRDLLPDYKQVVNWLLDPVPNYGSFTSSTTYDALNRPLTVTSPDGSVYRPTFNEANLLDKVEVNLRGVLDSNRDPVWTPFVINIDYNAKGQRTLIEYGCGAGPNCPGVTTAYEYDEHTFRLTHLNTTRPAGLNGLASDIFADPAVVQDLHYTYDPARNITRIGDGALKRILYKNQPVEPVCSYTYDAIYRLIEAKGREHIGQTVFDFSAPNRDNPFLGYRQPNNLQALCNYTESYDYDAVGNFKVIHHGANGGGWNRRHEYGADSLLKDGKKNNRLTKTIWGNGSSFTEAYTYADEQGSDVHGCMTAINSMKMVWDFEDQLQQVVLGGGGKAYYVYDAGGQRVRKVIETKDGAGQKERIYLGGFEIYREYNGTEETPALERETLHVMDDKQRIALAETQTIADGNRIDKPVPLQRYQLGNHLGSASLELAEDGELISYEEYHPYGTTAFQAGRSAAEISLKRYRYTGKERDEESGLYYHGARYYAPWLGRWTSCDPIWQPRVSLYVYADGNPVTFLDPQGTQVEAETANPFRLRSWVLTGGTRPASDGEAAAGAFQLRLSIMRLDQTAPAETMSPDARQIRSWKTYFLSHPDVGELTRVREGVLQRAYVPGGGVGVGAHSGVTIGVGLEVRHLPDRPAFALAIGADAPLTRWIMSVPNLQGAAAQQWLMTHPGTLTGAQARATYNVARPAYERRAQGRLTGIGPQGASPELRQTSAQYSRLAPTVTELLTDIAWNSAQMAFGRQNRIAKAINVLDDPRLIPPWLAEHMQLTGLRAFVDTLGTAVQSPRTRQMRSGWIDVRLEQLQKTSDQQFERSAQRLSSELNLELERLKALPSR